MRYTMKTDTHTLAAALDALARDIQSEDGVANAAIAEAAQRLREIEADRDWLAKENTDLREMPAQLLDVDAICAERDRLRSDLAATAARLGDAEQERDRLRDRINGALREKTMLDLRLGERMALRRELEEALGMEPGRPASDELLKEGVGRIRALREDKARLIAAGSVLADFVTNWCEPPIGRWALAAWKAAIDAARKDQP